MNIFQNVPDEDRDNWNIFVRKDVFLPSHNAAEDPVETGLIYSQIMGGIHVGEYRCSSVSTTLVRHPTFDKTDSSTCIGRM